MKLLPSVSLRRLRGLPSGTGFTLAVCGCLVGLEVLGRLVASDLQDVVGVFALIGLGLTVAVRHRREPLPWVSGLAGWVKRVAGSAAFLRYDHGFDLRGAPPIPRRVPPVVWVAALGLCVWAGLATLAWAVFPDGWRAAGVRSEYLPLYVPYLVCLLGLWASLLVCTFFGVYVPVTVLDRWLRRWLGETDRRGAELAAVVGYFVLVAAVAWAVPPAVVVGLCLVVAVGAVAVGVLPGRDPAALLWRAGADRPVYAVPLHRVMAVMTGLAALLVFDLLLTASGGLLFGSAPGTMPVTATLGALAAWTMPLLFTVAVVWVVTSRRTDPARRTPPMVRVTGADRMAVRRAATIIAGWGWRAKVTADPVPGAVGIEVVEPERSEAAEFDPRWPLRVGVADLEAGEVRARLERRDEIHVRRQLFRGLAKLFKRAGLYKGPGGGGFWLAPHWWFIEGLGRDDGDGAEDAAAAMIGPPYHRMVPPRARQHAHRVLRATAVDMLFVEDGVGYRKVEKVLRVLAELYDVHGGRRRAEELHFRGLPKVRVMIHEYEPGNPFRSAAYPEPKFDDLSRVRVLHVFRDRGGEEERVEPPFDFSWTPAPAGLMG
jgi:hypothetical protein